MEAAETFAALSLMVDVAMLVHDVGAVAAKEMLAVILRLNATSHDKTSEALKRMTSAFIHQVSPRLAREGFQSTKLSQLVSLLPKNGASKALVRVATRRGVFWLTRTLVSQGIRAAPLVGRTEMSESKTGEILKRFKCADGGVDVLVGTSLVEEGLDLHLCDRVIAYSVEGILHSGKSLIQNAGRARKEGSDFYVLCDGYADEMLVEDKQDQVDALERMLAKDLLMVDSSEKQ